MAKGRMPRACVIMLAALWLASPLRAAPISIIVDTHVLAGMSADIAFDVLASTENTVTIDSFSSDISLFDAITISGNVSGSLPDKVTLGGSPQTFFNEYLQTVALGDTLAFTFDTSALPVDTASGFGPDSFAFYVLVDGLPVETTDPTGAGALLLYNFGIENPNLTIFSSDTLSAREGIVSNVVAEPGEFALAAVALLALGLMLPAAQIRSRT